MNKKVILVLLLLVLALAFTAGCRGDGGGAAGAGGIVGAPDYVREHVVFNWHANYTWFSWPGAGWNGDMVSRHWSDMFDIYAVLTTPDGIADEILNLMIIANELPDAIWMDRGSQMQEMARLGLLYSIDELNQMVYRNYLYDLNVPLSTQLLYAELTDGVNYVIPNWVRMGTIGELGGATGGNVGWLYVSNVWEAVGSPTIRTFEDLYAYAVAVRDANLVNHQGLPIIPVLIHAATDQGQSFVNGIFGAFGGWWAGWGGWESIRPDGTFGSSWENPIWRDAVMEANRWFREGLFPATVFTNTDPMRNELLSNGRAGLMWIDHSLDDNVNFRTLLSEQDPGNSIELFISEVGGRYYTRFPSATRGITQQQVTHETHATLGWNGSVIVRGASNPGRIFELFTHMLSLPGSIEMTLGPPGVLWENLDADGFPIMTRSPALLTSDERLEIGLWNWDLKGHANNVDDAKFAANRGLPPEERNWVESMQENVFTPNLRLTDEFVNMTPTIPFGTPLAIRRTQITDFWEEMLPQIIMAATAEEANRLFDTVLQFNIDNGREEIDRIHHARWLYNLDLQGGTIFPVTPNRNFLPQ